MVLKGNLVINFGYSQALATDTLPKSVLQRMWHYFWTLSAKFIINMEDDHEDFFLQEFVVFEKYLGFFFCPLKGRRQKTTHKKNFIYTQRLK